MNYTVKEKKELSKSEISFLIEIPAEEIAKEIPSIIAQIAKDFELPGFRKGRIPENIIKEKMGMFAIWEEASTHALQNILPELLKLENLNVIGRPAVQTTKCAPDNHSEFRVIFTLFPKLSYPDYKKISSEHNKKPYPEPSITEKEIDEVISEIEKNHRQTAEKKDFKLTEETIKDIGGFESFADMKKKISANLLERKKYFAKEKRIEDLFNALISETTGELPKLLIEYEIDRFEAELKGRIEQLGASFETYLEKIKKDRETFRKEIAPEAEKRARLNLLFSEIARAEKITPDNDAVEAETKRIIQNHKDADQESVKIFVENAILNQKVSAFLENLK